MKRLVLSLLIATCHGAAALGQSCATPVEKQAFGVFALKSELMVGALSCNASARYDSFMTAFQPKLVADQRIVDLYFERHDGLAGQAQEDQFVTTLANDQSAASISQGVKFCAGDDKLFSRVIALNTAAGLDDFADAAALPMPISLAVCTPAAPPPTTIAAATLPPAAAPRHVAKRITKPAAPTVNMELATREI